MTQRHLAGATVQTNPKLVQIQFASSKQSQQRASLPSAGSSPARSSGGFETRSGEFLLAAEAAGKDNSSSQMAFNLSPASGWDSRERSALTKQLAK